MAPIALDAAKFIRQILTDPRIAFSPSRLNVLERRGHTLHSALKIVLLTLNMENARDNARVIYKFLDRGNADFELLERRFAPEDLSEPGLVAIFQSWLQRRQAPRLELENAPVDAGTAAERNRQMRELGVLN